MAVSEKQKQYARKWDSENMHTFSARVRKNDAELFKEYCDVKGSTPGKEIKLFIQTCIEEYLNKDSVIYSINEISELIKPVAQKYQAQKVILFGSAARGDFTEDSDYDFLILGSSIKTLIQYASIINELKDLLHRDVDIILDNCLDRQLIEAALNEGVVVYDSDT